ncbi:plasmid transfer protein TraA [Streptomyces sp. GbtcB6]|uniref:plasmid transfer protein TraA n=1 Tax=Streptomyces sp. GbtcB6 TaxID=2824751 RepID=UPI001C2FC7FF|nr:plasmid transfer protein TraA [Streptomyces sp. GbtcB6]
MADNGSANRANNRRYREAQQGSRPRIDESNGAYAKSSVNNKTWFAPGFTVNVNASRNTNGGAAGGGNGGRSHAEALLPAPEFTSPAQVRNYCNSLRAAAVTLSIEVAMGAEILKGVLEVVPDPEGRPFGSRSRARKVSRKLQKSADALRDAAKNAAATYATFQQQYEEEINRVRHRARRPQQPQINWAQQ